MGAWQAASDQNPFEEAFRRVAGGNDRGGAAATAQAEQDRAAAAAAARVERKFRAERATAVATAARHEAAKEAARAGESCVSS